MSVTSTYYELLHSLEEEGSLDPTNCLHLFSAQYVFKPRLTSDLHTFINSWNNHPLRTEKNLTPTLGHWQSIESSPICWLCTAHPWPRCPKSRRKPAGLWNCSPTDCMSPDTAKYGTVKGPIQPNCTFMWFWKSNIHFSFKFCCPSQYCTSVKHQHVKMRNLYKAHTMLRALLFIVQNAS